LCKPRHDLFQGQAGSSLIMIHPVRNDFTGFATAA